MLALIPPVLVIVLALAQAAPATSAPKHPAPAAASASPLKPWTLLIYGAADNNADGHMLDFLNGLRAAVADDPGLDVVCFIDRSTGFSTDAKTFGEDFTGARIYRLGATTATRLAGGEEFPEIALDREWEADSADPENLRKFLAFGKAHAPARRFGLLIYGHASGISMCPDEQSRHDMGITQLTDVVTEAESVDWMALELCNMGGIEIAYQWRPGNGGFSTDVLVAIPNAGPPLDWNRIFSRVHSPSHPAAAGRDDCLDPATMTAQQFGRVAVEEGERGRRAAAAAAAAQGGDARAAAEAAAAYDLLAVEEVKAAIDAFAVELAGAGAGTQESLAAKAAMEELRGSAGHDPVMNYVEEQFTSGHSFVDLAALLVRAAACEKLPPPARAAAQLALEKCDAFVLASFGMSGYAGFEPGRNGVFILFPDGDAPLARVASGHTRAWGRCDWYVPFEFARDGTTLGGWAWCRDGATPGDGVVQNWFELLDAWFDVDDGERGGENGYRW